VKRLWNEYRATLKCLDVEETVDVFLHRPPAFLIAKLAFRTPITPNQLTFISAFIGVAAGITLFLPGAHAHWIAAALIYLSQVVDCSDGMLARMRKSSSDLGRMLDGFADSITLSTIFLGSAYQIVMRYSSLSYAGVPIAWVALAVLAYPTYISSAWHTASYDHYKNLYVRLTTPTRCDDEDVENAQARYERSQARGMGLLERCAWPVYLYYIKSQRKFIGWFDPYTAVRLRPLPPYDETRAAIYRRHALGLMRLWRRLFGVGSLVFGLAVFNAIGRPDWFLVVRLVIMNALFFGYLWPVQRRASRAAFQELGIDVARVAAGQSAFGPSDEDASGPEIAALPGGPEAVLPTPAPSGVER